MRAATYAVVWHENPEFVGLVYELVAEMRPDLSRFAKHPEPPKFPLLTRSDQAWTPPEDWKNG